MTELKHTADVAIDAALRLQNLICLARLRYGSVLMTLPLCSSMCFFAFRFALSAFGTSM
ncbi:hypothetical protein [Caballeronia insecticola]|uniref:Uncharacterized protein n=1 Tax=Caballeronia insecticola TaxID=758793 RepID=R4X3L4_9BURK|nr:hypothetical protein [Caballeronia insecticola]BAN26482.1 hypothetical protein BRPE64_CCDS03990 [Caballeronia insecticola]